MREQLEGVGRNSNGNGPGGRRDNYNPNRGTTSPTKKTEKKTEWIVSPPRQKLERRTDSPGGLTIHP